MKKIKLLLCFSFLVLSASLSFGQSWLWGEGGYGGIKSTNYGAPVATDNNGNAYITGYYYNSIVFGRDTLKCINDNAYLVKYDASGNIIWAVQPVDSVNSYSYGVSLATDNSGNIYISGNFSGAISFGSLTLRSPLYGAFFLAKYSSTGSALWAKQSINSYYTYTTGGSIATDFNNNVFLTGSFMDTIKFGSNKLTSVSLCPFLVKYDSSGNEIWAKQAILPSTSCHGYLNSVTCDEAGNIYITGQFQTAMFFGAIQLISLNNYSSFIAKYSAGGNVLWAKESVNLNAIYGDCYSESVVTDSKNNVYITGSFEDSVKFGSNIFYSPNYYYETFLTKYDTNGNVIWAKQSSVGFAGLSLTTDKLNHLYLGGTTNLEDTIYTFGGYALHSSAWANGNAFILKFDTNGKAICGSIIENIGNYSNSNIGITSGSNTDNYIYMAGTFSNDTLIFGPDNLIAANGGMAVFLARWQNCAVDAGINELKTNNEKLRVYPNPFNNSTTIVLNTQSSLPNTHYLELDDLTGRKLRWIEFTGNQYQLQAQDLAKGIYFIRAFDNDMNVIGTSKIVVQ